MAALAERTYYGTVLAELQNAMVTTVSGLDAGWDERYVAARHLIAAEPALFHYVK